MIPLALLYLLATLDAAFLGFRTAAGRSALIRKSDYYRRAMISGALQGQVPIGAAGTLAVLLLMKDEAHRASLFAGMQAASVRMLQVYAPYAAVVLGALAVRTVRSVDVRSLMSVLVFGPLTLLRPLVILAGGVHAWLGAEQPAVRGVVAFAMLLILTFRPMPPGEPEASPARGPSRTPGTGR